MMSGFITLLEKIDQMIITQSREAQLANQAQIENGDYASFHAVSHSTK